MTKNIAISIAMATYNGAKFLEEQLISLQTQTVLPHELIVTDDQSFDDTVNILEKFKSISRFPVIIHRNEARLGFRANFMKAARLCSGELIAFCDQDDIWLDTKLAKVQMVFNDQDICLCFHNAEIIDAGGNFTGFLRNDRLTPDVLPPLSISPWFSVPGFTQVFRNEYPFLHDKWSETIEPNIPNQPMSHDQWTIFIASMSGNIKYIHESLAKYRQHGNNTYGWAQPGGFRERLKYILEDRTEVYARATRYAQKCTLITGDIAAHLPADKSSRAATAALQWRLLEEMYRNRLAIYQQRSIVARIKGFVALMRTNGYTEGGVWSFGGKGMLKDLVLGVLLGPLTARHGFAASRGDPTCKRVGGLWS